MTSPDDETPKVESGSSSPNDAMGRIARARARAQEAKQAGARLLEREQTRRKWVRVAIEAYDRHRRFAGGMLAGGLAFRFFLWLLPFSLVAVTALQGFSEGLESRRPSLPIAQGCRRLPNAAIGITAALSHERFPQWIWFTGQKASEANSRGQIVKTPPTGG
jgi:hypothetical protein